MKKECRNTFSSILESQKGNDMGVRVFARDNLGNGVAIPPLKIFHIFFNNRLENLKS